MADTDPFEPADTDATDPRGGDAPPSGLEILKRERDDYYDRLLRKTAEFDNYRRRIERERRAQADQAVVDLLLDLLLIVDDFDLALAAPSGEGAAPYRRGVELIRNKLQDLLKKQGIAPIVALGADFNPNVHQAVTHEHSPHHREGEVLAELRRGYMMGDRLLQAGDGKGEQGVSKRDYYEILEVTRTASDGEIKSSYRKLALKYHPDRNPGDKTAEERFKEAAEAYAVLCDGEKRSLYDRFGHQGVKGAGAGGPGFDPSVFSEFGDFGDILGSMFGFGDMFGGRRRGGPQRGADLRYDLEVTFEESAKGAETTIQIPRQESCETCQGSGAAPGTTAQTCTQCRGQGQVRFQQGIFTVARACPQCQGSGKTISKPCTTCRGAGRVSHDRKITVKIPAGIAEGQQLRLQGEGEAGTAGGPAGHLFVVIHVREHEYLRRDGVNLFCEVPVNFTTLALGGEIQVPTLDGSDSVKIAEGTETGTTLRMRGKGMPDVNGRGRGDLFATVQVQTPKKLSKETRHLLEQLAKALPKEKFEPRAHGEEPDERNLFDRVKDMFG